MRSIRFSDQVFSPLPSQQQQDTRRQAYSLRDLSSSNGSGSSSRLLNSRVPSGTSDTSSAAGFFVQQQQHRKSAIQRGYAIDNDYLRQDYLDEVEYRGSNSVAGSASSPYSHSQRSLDGGGGGGSGSTAILRPSSSQATILRNGGGTTTLPRSRTSNSSYGTMERNNRPSSVYSMDNGSGSRVMNQRSSNGRLNGGGGIKVPSEVSRRNGGSEYPVLPPKSSSSMQIIATRHKPCCGGGGCCGGCFGKVLSKFGLGSGSDTADGSAATTAGAGGRPTPICVLFTIFLVFSLLVIAGIMLYLKAGHVTSLLSSGSSSSSSSKQHSALSTKRCDDGVCAFGGVCVRSGGGGSRCQCDDTCPFVYAPVCGSDGVSYDNECRLKLAACQRRRPIRQVHAGECGRNDPCERLTCPKFASCVPSFDGSSASCQCPQICQDKDAANETVCGTNGRDYPSECHLEKEACERRQLDLRVRYRGGRCNPCQSLNCDSNAECHLQEQQEEALLPLLSGGEDNVKRVPKCMCKLDCPEEARPVCASNGKTYRNECTMKLDSCRKRTGLHVVYPGNCSYGLNQCRLLSCQYGEECSTTKQGISECACPAACERIVRPVCASDGLTYDNLCEMTRHGCLKKIELRERYFGNCESKGPCSKRVCNHHSVCVESGDLAFCECPRCGEEWEPVCGSDGHTHDNECKLRLAACRKETNITIVERGPCSGCANVTCDLYAVCESGGDNRPGVCRCPTSCDQLPGHSPLDQQVVCGTDGISYHSECQLKMEACRKQQFIVVANLGNCDLCRDVSCKHGARCEAGICICPTDCPKSRKSEDDEEEEYPLCATDGNSYANECEILKRSCELGAPISVLHHGRCDDHGILEPPPLPPLPPPVTTTTTTPSEDDDFDLDFEKLSSSRDHLEAACARGGACRDGPSGSSPCICNQLGISPYSDGECDPDTGRCECLPGVGGAACDRCLPGHWGFRLQQRPAGSGCAKCECNPFGSVRSDCEQMAGRCVCKPGLLGAKCDLCPDGRTKVSPIGCEGLYFPFGSEAKSCGSETCQFGAQCRFTSSGKQRCTCDIECLGGGETARTPVCGSDGNTYRSECQLLQYTCRYKKHIFITAYAPCKGERQQQLTPNPAESDFYPVTPSSNEVFSDAPSSMYKSTRDLPRYGSNGPTPFPPSSAFGTTIVVFGVVGDLCLQDDDCTAEGSVCMARKCACPHGFREGNQGRTCLKQINGSGGPCSLQPCLGEGTCEEHDGTFTCFCTADRTGDRCERRLADTDVAVPSFNGRSSFVELKPLEREKHRFSLEVEFLAYGRDGVIMHSQEQGGGQGFVSLSLSDGYVEFRYDLGSGLAILRTRKRVTLGHWHRVQAKRWHRDGTLKLDHHDNVDGQSSGAARALDLAKSPTFVGATDATTSSGSFFHGCIRSFKLGAREVKIQSASEPMSLRRISLSECGSSPCAALPCGNRGNCVVLKEEEEKGRFACRCSPGFAGPQCEMEMAEMPLVDDSVLPDPCLSSPCEGGGICSSFKSEESLVEEEEEEEADFVCECPLGRTGRRCEEQVEDTAGVQPSSSIFVPAFDGHSYLELPTLKHVSKAFQLEIWFLTFGDDGALLYNGQNSNGHGDFVAVSLIDSRVHFRYDLGSGVMSLSSPERVTGDEWHRVRVTRNGRHGTLQVDDGQIVSGSSLGTLTELNLELPLYLGGFKFSYSLSRDSGITVGLNGAIQRLIVNGNPIESLMDHVKDSRNIARYSGPPCDDNPCLNGGVCKPLLSSFICKCQKEFRGQFCEQQMQHLDEQAAVFFDGQTFLNFMNKGGNRFNLTNDDVRSESEWQPDGDFEDDNDDDDDALLFDPSDSREEEDEEDDEADGRRGEKHNKLQVEFRTTASDGLLLWTNQGATLQGDFLALAIVNGFPEVSFNLGGKSQQQVQQKPIRISAKTRVDDGEWHKVKVVRKRRTAILQVDNQKPERGRSKKGASVLNTDGKIWIGGKHSLPSGLPLPYYKGFQGCVKTARVFRKRLNLLRGDNSHLQLCSVP